MLKPHNPFKAVKASAWFSPTHSYIFDTAFKILKDRDHDAYREFRAVQDDIERGCLIPDFKGDINKGSGAHYYSAVLKNGAKAQQVACYYKNRLGKFSKSARTMCEENITMAAIFKKSDNRKMYGESIGRALHFIMDICCTVHTTNLVSLPFKNNPHNRYEVYAKANMNRLTADDIPDLDAFEKKYMNKSIGEMFNCLAETSSKYYCDMTDLSDESLWHALKEMLPICFAATYVLMRKIYKYCENYNGIKEGDSVLLKTRGRFVSSHRTRIFVGNEKSCACAFTLCVHGGKLYLSSDGKYLTSDGDFGFRLAGISSHCAVRITKTSRGYLFSTEFSNGEKYICEHKGQLKAKYFDPTCDGFYFKCLHA